MSVRFVLIRSRYESDLTVPLFQVQNDICDQHNQIKKI